jgi:hypothetical protein
MGKKRGSKKKRSGRSLAMIVVIIVVVAAGAFIAYNDGLIGATSIPNIDEDYKDQTITVRGRVHSVIDINWMGIDFEGFVITDADNNSIYVAYDGDLPTVGNCVVVVGEVVEIIFIITDYYINGSSWRPVLIFQQ